ncbi:hypothetical protein LSTR_LSTR016169 [Laodelphax striatellus]|uniref:Uncharacterized protein n=1 Tax=Laodelphax striatellus TaxID=195883 RepID=A0A482WM98_LAOST|nr:hypothetical protein LSTR_LSTR016169 [Laodelphax striatellus]
MVFSPDLLLTFFNFVVWRVQELSFIAQLVKGVDLEKCIKCGIWAASRVIERSGCTFDVTQSYNNGD